MGTASLQLRKVAPISALAALDITAWIILACERIGPLMSGTLGIEVGRSLKKKWPPDWLRAPGSVR